VVVALLSLECHLPTARSLKDKRMVIRSLKDRIGRFNVALAETGHQDVWQRAGLSVVTVAATEALAERELEAVLDEIERREPGLVLRSDIEFLT
jgi:uncharacterized protein YlxP (DUF503 family)